MKKGYVQIYTGDGKGKTTAAFGLAMRASGAGFKVFIGQFVKGRNYSELKTFPKLENIEIKQYGQESFIIDKPSETDIRLAREGLKEIESKLVSGDYDIVILDEGNIAIFFKLFTAEELIEVLEKRAPKTEVVITGRRATDQLIEYADLVTEMKEIKHYYTQGVEARTGIEK